MCEGIPGGYIFILSGKVYVYQPFSFMLSFDSEIFNCVFRLSMVSFCHINPCFSFYFACVNSSLFQEQVPFLRLLFYIYCFMMFFVGLPISALKLSTFICWFDPFPPSLSFRKLSDIVGNFFTVGQSCTANYIMQINVFCLCCNVFAVNIVVIQVSHFKKLRVVF